MTPAHIDEIVFQRLPSDSGVVSPVARPDEPLDPEVETDLEEVRSRLVTWGPAQSADPVQRVRNVLYVAAVPDVFQMPLERHLPHIVFERLQGDIPKDDLIKLLYWVATHPAGGDDSAVDDLRSAGLKVNGPGDMEQTRERVMLYALKLLGRVAGRFRNRTNPKLQIPSSNHSQIPTPKVKSQLPRSNPAPTAAVHALAWTAWYEVEDWDVGISLGVGIWEWLGFGAWSLGFAYCSC